MLSIPIEVQSYARRRRPKWSGADARPSEVIALIDTELVDALRDLLQAIDRGVERRVLLNKPPTEPRTQSIIRTQQIFDEYGRARAALATAEYSAGIPAHARA